MAGRIQGVGFRYFTRQTAQRLGISGWVRNLPGGRVEAEAQAGTPDLAVFELELRRGPPGSLVTEFASTEISDEQDPVNRFEIR